tara:strand:- start:8592 stop:9122 length:531 start_codon:yes stop_codon:yes gene_type:complete
MVMTKATASKTTANAKTAENATFKAAQETVEQAAKTAQETVQTATKAAQDSVKQATQEATKGFEKVTAFNKANYEALVASSKIAAETAQSVNADFVETTKAAVEKNVADVKTLFAAKTPAEFFELQTSMLKGRYDDFVAEATKFNEAATKTTNDVVAPLKARYEAVAEEFNLPQAK